MSPSDIFRIVTIAGSTIGLLGAIGLFFTTRTSEKTKSARIEVLETDLKSKETRIKQLQDFSDSIKPGLSLLSKRSSEDQGAYKLHLSFGSKFPAPLTSYEIEFETSTPYEEVTYKTEGRINTRDGITPMSITPSSNLVHLRGTNLSANCTIELEVVSKEPILSIRLK